MPVVFSTRGVPDPPLPAASAPNFSPGGGTYSSSQLVTISTTTPSPTIYYTTDGSTPTILSTVYGGPITVSVSETVQAIATAPGYKQSSVGSAAYTISSGTTFDFYISTTGSDTNAGTLAAPWAITSLRTNSANFSKFNGVGKRIGLLPGTYDVSSLVFNDPFTGALQIPGGTSGTQNYLGSSDANGFYSARTATLDMKGASGLFGGHNSAGAGQWDGPMLSHTGRSFLTGSLVTYSIGNLTIDGIVFKGFNYKGIRIGGNSSGDGPIITAPVTFQNCELTAGGFNAGDFQDNLCALWVDTFQPTGQGCLVTNNWVHDIAGFSANNADHLTPLFVFTAPSQGWGYEFSYNTVFNAGGGPYGKEGGVNGSNVHHNYVDVSMFTSFSTGYLDWASGSTDLHTGLTKTTFFNHNILVIRGNTAGSNNGFGFPTLGQNGFGSVWGWQTAVECYNNTIVSASGTAGPLVTYAVAANDGVGLGGFKHYNNIYVNNGSSGSWNGFGNFMTTAKTPLIWDYNLYPSSGVSWGVVPEAANGSLCASHTVYTSAAAFAAGVSGGGGISGVEAHGIAGAPTFTNTGIYAALYKLTAGSTGHNAGNDGTDMGAWGAGTTQIGCSFAV